MIMLDSIKIGQRFRDQLNGSEVGESLVELQEGIKEHGLLHPVVIDSDNNLVAGFRRYMCCKQLGWLEIPCNRLGDLNDTQRLEIELEENLLRKKFEWDEVIALRKRIHEVKQQLYGQPISHRPAAGQIDTGWSLADTAESLKTSKPRLSADVTFATVVESIPQLVAKDDNGKKLFTRTEAERQVKKLIEQLERELSLRQSMKAMAAVENVALGDVLDHIKSVPDSTVDCIIFDPPYGTDVQDIALYQGRLYRTDSHFQDDRGRAEALIRELLPELKRVMKPNAHLYCFFGITEYTWIYDLLYSTFNSRLDAIPLIWSKDGNRWGTGDWQHHYTRSYEGIFFVTSPDRSLFNVHPSVLTEGAGEDVKFTAQKPVGLIRFLIEQSTNAGELVLDPTCGHGTTPVVCVQTGRRFWACESVESAYRETKARVAHVMREKAEREAPVILESEDDDWKVDTDDTDGEHTGDADF